MCACVVEASDVGFHFHAERICSYSQAPFNYAHFDRKRKCSDGVRSAQTFEESVPLAKVSRHPPIFLPPASSPVHGVKSERGSRAYMEDMYTAMPKFSQLPDGRPVSFYSVYDGHGGDYVAKYCSEVMHQHLKVDLDSISLDAFSDGSQVESALQASFRRTDEELKRSGKANLVGSTAVVVLVTEESYFIASCGDSRAVLCRDGKTVALTDDHSPEREDEKMRIKEHGGCVVFRHGVHRVMGALAVSRAIGDHCLQQYGVTYEPDTSSAERQANDEFLLLASDGLFSVLSNEEAVELTRRSLERARSKGACGDAAARIAANVLTRIALHRGAQDNVTVMVVDLFPTSSKPIARRTAL